MFSLIGTFVTLMLAFGWITAKLKYSRLNGSECIDEIPFTQMERKATVVKPKIVWNLYFCNDVVSAHCDTFVWFNITRLASGILANKSLNPVSIL